MPVERSDLSSLAVRVANETMIVPGRDKDGAVVEPLRGLRFYALGADGGNPYLVGGFGGKWLSVEDTASCYGDYARCRAHLLSNSCSCGFYIRTDMQNIQPLSPVEALCIGWGAAAVYDKGARVEHIRMLGLRVNGKYFGDDLVTRIITQLEARYGVPVEAAQW